MLAVLLSERAARTVLSASVLFIGVGFLPGGSGMGWVQLSVRDGVSEEFAELALFVILLVDGSQVPVGELRRAWHLPGRVRLFGSNRKAVVGWRLWFGAVDRCSARSTASIRSGLTAFGERKHLPQRPSGCVATFTDDPCRGNDETKARKGRKASAITGAGGEQSDIMGEIQYGVPPGLQD